MIVAYLGQTHEVLRTDLRAKHQSKFSIATLIIRYNGLTMSINSAATSSLGAVKFVAMETGVLFMLLLCTFLVLLTSTMT
jgi:hypothetical protein